MEQDSLNEHTGHHPQSGSAQHEERRDRFQDRLNSAAGDISYRKLGKLTDTHPETVRRYMQGQAPSASFMTNLCRELGISGEWLLTGRGPMKRTDMRSHALRHADPSELLTAVANTLTDLCDRMDRLERFVQSIEIKLRASAETRGSDADAGSKASRSGKAGACTPAPAAGPQTPRDPVSGDAHQRERDKPKPGGSYSERIRRALAE